MPHVDHTRPRTIRQLSALALFLPALLAFVLTPVRTAAASAGPLEPAPEQLAATPADGMPKVVTLEHAEPIRGMILPPGTRVTENAAGTWIKDATLSQAADYRGISVPAGTSLTLSNARLTDQVARVGRLNLKDAKDEFADLAVTAMSHPGGWDFGKLRVGNSVHILAGEGLAVTCVASDQHCRFGDADVSQAEFWPDGSFRHLKMRTEHGRALPVRAGDDVLQVRNIWYWPNGQVHLLVMDDEKQRFRGKLAGRILRFWQDGSIQSWMGRPYCRNGVEASLALPPGSLPEAIAGCADGSVRYVPRDALCHELPELAIRKYDFLRNRPRDGLLECRYPTSPARGRASADAQAVADYMPVFVEADN